MSDLVQKLVGALEVWAPIKTIESGAYEVSDFGGVRKNGKALSIHGNEKGYQKVSVAGRSVFVHRLVAEAFLSNPNDLPEVNHKDGNKENNHRSNLEWCSRSQNMKHAYATGLHPGVVVRGEKSPHFGKCGAKHAQSMPVRATFSDGSFRDYESQGMASRDGFKPHKISECINGRRRRHMGATWQPLPAPPAQKLDQATNKDTLCRATSAEPSPGRSCPAPTEPHQGQTTSDAGLESSAG